MRQTYTHTRAENLSRPKKATASFYHSDASLSLSLRVDISHLTGPRATRARLFKKSSDDDNAKVPSLTAHCVHIQTRVFSSRLLDEIPSTAFEARHRAGDESDCAHERAREKRVERVKSVERCECTLEILQESKLILGSSSSSSFCVSAENSNAKVFMHRSRSWFAYRISCFPGKFFLDFYKVFSLEIFY